MTGSITADSQRQLGRIARGGAINLVGAVVSAGAGFLLVVLVTNSFDEETAGRLFAAVSAFLIGIAVATLGSDTGLARFLLPQEAAGVRRGLRGTVSIALRPVAVTAVLLGLISFLGADLLAPLIGLDGRGGAGIVRMFAVALPIAALGDFWLGCTRAFGRMRPTVALDSILRSGLQVVAVLAIGWAGGGEIALSAAWSLPYVVAGILSTIVALRLLGERTREEDRGDGDHLVGAGEFWTYTWPRAVARVSQIALQRIDIVLVAAILGVRDAALYTAATRFVVLGQFATQAIQRVLQPRLSHLIAAGETATVRDVFKVSTAWSMVLSWPIYLVVACSAPLYLRLFGSGYADDAVPVVVIMAIGMLLAIAAGPLDTLLLMAGKSATSLAITLVALALDIGLLVVLLPHLGIAGAALAWAIAVVVRNLLTFLQVYRMSGVTPLSRGAAIVAAASVGCFAVPVLVGTWAVGLGLLMLSVSVVLGSCAYGVVLWLARDALALGALRALLPGGSGRNRPADGSTEGRSDRSST